MCTKYVKFVRNLNSFQTKSQFEVSILDPPNQYFSICGTQTAAGPVVSILLYTSPKIILSVKIPTFYHQQHFPFTLGK